MMFGQHGQVGAVPALKARVVYTRRGQFYQVAHAPADKIAVAFQIAVAAGGDAQNFRDGAGDRGLLGND